MIQGFVFQTMTCSGLNIPYMFANERGEGFNINYKKGKSLNF